jgi:hypothetical protein
MRRSQFSAGGQPATAPWGAPSVREPEAVAPVDTRTPRHRDEERLLTRRVRSTVKLVARSLSPTPADRRRLVLIFGCQRSGTTMLQQTMLDRSWRVFILEEHDRRLVGKSAAPDETEWDDVPVVLDRIGHLPFEVVAVKPLVESDRAGGLLDAKDNARGIWMLRHYGDVARSNLRRFGLDNAHRDLQPMVSGSRYDWRSRRATEQTRRTVVDVLSQGLDPLDAAALFWWARNQLYFDQDLAADNRVRVLRYERVRLCPEEVVSSLSRFVGVPLPIRSTVRRVRTPSDADRPNGLDPKVEALCAALWERFEGCPEL